MINWILNHFGYEKTFDIKTKEENMDLAMHTSDGIATLISCYLMPGMKCEYLPVDMQWKLTLQFLDEERTILCDNAPFPNKSCAIRDMYSAETKEWRDEIIKNFINAPVIKINKEAKE